MAGLNADDIISEINGVRVSNMTDGDISSVLSGYNSGTAKLKVLTPYGNRFVTLRRATVVLVDADVIYRAENKGANGILELIVHKVSDSAVDIINEALARHSDASGVVLDLRTSTGDDERAAAGD